MTNVATTDCGAPANGSNRRRSALLILLSAIGLALCATASPALAGGFERTGDLNVPRADPMVVKLADGKVLVAGGWTAGHAITQTAEIYDPATGTYTLTGSMARERRMGAAILLQSGKVLVVGGTGLVGAAAATAELFDPATGTFSDVSSPMSGDRVWPLVTLLNSGKVLVSHGCCGDGLGADLYDPASGATGTFTPTVGRPSQLFSHSTGAATKLADGKVLFAGDWNDDLSGQHAQIYDPGSDSFSATTGLMTQARVTVMALRLASGKVLIAGGEGATGNTAETFDPTTGLFTAAGGTMSASRSGGYIAPLPDGKVLVAGGTDSWAGTPNNSADIFDPATGTFTPAGSMAVARRQLVVANPPVLSGGRVLFAGGSTSPEADPTWSSPTRISELYVPGSVTPTPDPVTPTPDPVTPTPDPVTPTPDPVTPKPSPSPLTPLAPSNTFTLSPSRVLGSSITSLIIVTGRGVTNQRGSFSGGAGARNSKTLTACRSSRKITKAGRYKLTCTLTSAARSARRRGPIRVTLTTTFTPTGGTARSATRKVTLKKASSGVTG